MAEVSNQEFKATFTSQRNLMNSENLQERFSEIYREFFSKCSIVASAPGGFTWTGEYAVSYGGLGIAQNLPLRFYVGLEPTGKEGFEFDETILNYDQSKDSFDSFSLPATQVANFSKMLEISLQNLDIKDRLGFKIHFLNEIPRQSGLNGSGALVASLSFILHILGKKINLREIESWKSKNSLELLNNNEFNSIFRLAWRFNTIFHTERSSGFTSLVPLVRSSFPIVYFTEKRGEDDVNTPLEKRKVWAFRMNELFRYPSLPPWPVDIWLFSSGELKPTELSMKAIDFDRQQWQNIANQARQIITPFVDNQDKHASLFFSDVFRENDKIFKNIITALSSFSIRTLTHFKQIFDSGGSTGTLNSFFELINKYQDCLDLLAFSSENSKKICQTLGLLPRMYNLSQGIATKTAGGLGSILLVTGLDVLRDKFQAVVQMLREATQKPISTQYLSWQDGFSEQGVKIEQFLEQNIYSTFISTGAVEARYLTPSGQFQRRLLSIEEFETIENKADLILDKIEQKIIVGGQPLDSREIHSAKETILVLEKLLESSSKKIDNRQLPESSYSQDRNLMSGKIIIPLERAAQKYLGRNLGIKIRGGLTEFNLELNNQNSSIYLKDKIF